AKRSQIRGHHTRFRRPAGMKRLRHGAKVFAQAGGLTGGNSQRADSGVEIQADDSCGSRSGSNRATCSRAMKSLLVMARRDGFGDLTLYFNADMIGGHQVAPGHFPSFGSGKRRRESSRSRVSQQTIDAIFSHGQLSIVVVVGMDTDAVRESGEARWRL